MMLCAPRLQLPQLFRYLVCLAVLLASCGVPLADAATPSAALRPTAVSVSSCDEASLDAALALGGTVVFACDGTIVLSAQKVISRDTVLDAGSRDVTISGGDRVRLFYVNPGVSFAIRGLTLTRALANGHGGAIYNDAGTLLVRATSFVENNTGSFNNDSQGSGGAIANVGGAVTIVGSLFLDNRARTSGDAVANISGTMSLANSTLSNYYDLVYNGPDGSLVLTNATLHAHGVLTAITSYGVVTMTNTIAYGGCSSAVRDGGNNIQWSYSSTSACGPGVRQINPMLSALADNGGPTKTMALSDWSPARGAGSPAACAGALVAGTDQRGEPRLADGACDIGAFEGALKGPTIKLSFTPETIPLSGTTVLRIALSNPNDDLSLSGVAFGNVLAPQLLVGAGRLVQSSCQGAVVQATAESSVVAASGIELPAQASCALEVEVTGRQAGTWTSYSGSVDAEGGRYYAVETALLKVGTPASTTLTTCDEASLDTALQLGGTIVFACDGEIPFGAVKRIERHVTLDASGRKVTLSGRGVVQLFVVFPGASLTLRELTLANGYTLSGGSAIKAHRDSLTTISNSSFLNHRAPAISNENGLVLVDGSTFSGNRGAFRGGAIYNRYPKSLLRVSNSTFSDNEASEGAAIHTEDGAYTDLRSVTIAANKGVRGSLATDGGGVSATNTILVDNPGGAVCYGIQAMRAEASLQWPGTSCGHTLRSVDPRVRALAANGGPTLTIGLLAGSAALDAGSPALCAAPPVAGLDQRGVMRLADGACDIGAYEGSSAVLSPTVALQLALPSITAGTTTTLRIRIANPNSDQALHQIALVASLPPELGVVGGIRSSSCGGSVSATAAAVTIAGVALASATSCDVRVAVTGTKVGTWGTTVTRVSSEETGSEALVAGAALTIKPAAVKSLVVSALPSVVELGQVAHLRATFYDSYGNVTPYQGTLTFSSSDPRAQLPSSYTFTAQDAGVHAFAVQFNTPGSASLFVGDQQQPALSAGQSVTVRTLSATDSRFPGISAAAAAWSDYDADGDLDLAISGLDEHGLPLARLYANRQGGFVELLGLSLQPVFDGSADWADYDGDGDQDLLLTGCSDLACMTPLTRLYRNQSGAGLVSSGVALAHVARGDAAWGDYDGDGDQDLLLAGRNAAELSVALVYRNDSGTLTRLSAGLPGVERGVAEWVDYDRDGDLDVLLAGSGLADLYENVAGSFVVRQLGLPGLTNAAAGWADYDGDGDPDLALAGVAGDVYLSRLYRNQGAGTFVESGQALAPASAGSVAWGDYDRDGDPDLLLAGRTSATLAQTTVYRNNGDGTFDATQIWLPVLGELLAQWVDANGDLQPDIFFSGKNDGFLPLTSLYYNDQGSFSQTPLPGVSNGVGRWADYDADGDLDVFLSGYSADGQFLTRIYRKDPAGYTALGVDFGGVYRVAAEWGDYDNDGDLDLFVAGEVPLPGRTERSARIYRNDAGAFVDIAAGLVPLLEPSGAWGDYDGDGDLDLVLAGHSATGARTTIYDNDGGSFTSRDDGLPGVATGVVAWGDYDGDRDLDLLLNGTNLQGHALTRLYRNDGDQFVDAQAGLPDLYYGSAAWGDYDGDGDLDLAFVGTYNGSYHSSKVYRNSGGVLTDSGVNLGTGRNWGVSWADYNNDGWLDLFLASQTGGVYVNNRGGGFGVSKIHLEAYTLSSAVWGDYDGDRDLDLLVVGQYGGYELITRIYKNEHLAVNTRPAAPGGLAAKVGASGVILSWAAASDGQTPAAGLSYNVRIGTQPGLGDVLSPMSRESGLRLVSAYGNAAGRSKIILGLRHGAVYYWSVQAVDNSYVGSPFATSGSFVFNLPPVADAGADQVVLVGQQVALAGSGSDPDGDQSLSYQWSQLSGPAVTLGDPQTASTTFMAPTVPATLTFSLVVRDSDGMTSSPSTVTVVVRDQTIAGLQAAGPAEALAGASLHFTGTVETGSNVRYTWAFGDGGQAQGATVSHRYQAAGDYEVLLTVANASSVVTTTLSVTVLPAADLSAVVSGGLLSLGDRSARLSVVVGNAGPSPATGITLTLSLAGSFVADSLPEGCLADQLTIVCAVASLEAGQHIGLPVRVTLGATMPASVEIVVAGREADPAPQNNRAGPVQLKLQHMTYLPLLGGGPS